jgi:hypothetical protein
MRRAFERLPEEMKARLEGMTAVHALASGYDGATAPSAHLLLTPPPGYRCSAERG